MTEGPENLTVHVLKELREEIRSTREELRADIQDVRIDLRAELRETREELGARIDANSQRIVETEMRTATAIVEMHGTLREVLGALRGQLDLRGRVERNEQDIARLKAKVGD